MTLPHGFSISSIHLPGAPKSDSLSSSSAFLACWALTLGFVLPFYFASYRHLRRDDPVTIRFRLQSVTLLSSLTPFFLFVLLSGSPGLESHQVSKIFFPRNSIVREFRTK